jgi:sugar/nucleoside kinase (ribokinase family)
MGVAPHVVVVGSASRDLVDDDPRGWRLGGGVSYSALALARLRVRVHALIGVDALAATASELDLIRTAGADVRLVPLDRGPVFVNRETPGGRVQESHEVSDPIPVEALPGAWADARGWLFAPVAAEIPTTWAAVPPADALVAVAWQGLLRVLAAGGRVARVEPAPSPLIARADLVGVGTDDFARGTPLQRLARLVGAGDTLLVTDGVRGGTAIETAADGSSMARSRWVAIPTPRFVDPTGAGDTFLAAVLAARLDPVLLGDRGGDGLDLRFGAAAASLACEGPGLQGVPTLDAVLERLDARGDATGKDS